MVRQFPPVSFSLSIRGRWPRWLFMLLASMSGAAALWIFYIRPWLGGVSRLDRWIDQHACEIRTLCVPTFELPNQVGMLAAILSILFFALALWKTPGIWRDRQPEALRVSWAPQSWRTWLAVLMTVFGLGVVAYEAVQALDGAVPSTYLWLAGLAALTLAAVFWDAVDVSSLTITMADLTVAVGLAVTVIGVGGMLAWQLPGVLLVLAGLAVFLAGSWWSQRAGSHLAVGEHATMLVLSLAALLLAMSRAWSWRFAFIGDEWTFYEVARSLLHRPSALQLLGLRNPNDYHSVFSFALQSWVMRVGGESVFGWRLASVLPFALSVPAVYVFLRWLAGRAAAFLGAGLFAGSHLLLGFSMIGYNNTQALLPLTLGLGLFAFAHQAQRASFLRYLLIGMALGLGLFVFGLARLAVLPVGLLLLVSSWPLRRNVVPGWVPAMVGGVAVGVPMLFNLSNWRAMLGATPLESEVAGDSGAAGLQMLYNVLRGSMVFLTGARNTHFIAGPHVDLLTALLLLAGLGFVLSSLRAHKSARAWLAASGLFVLVVSGVQQYGVISNTRMFILAPIYAVFAGIGGAALLAFLFPRDRLARGVIAGMLVVAGGALNLMHLDRISLASSYWPLQTLVVQQLQASEAIDRGGMPVFVVTQSPTAPLENRIARAHDAGRERLVFLGAEEALDLPHLCQAGTGRAMVLVDPRVDQVDLIRRRVADCWPGYMVSIIPDQDGKPGLLRFITGPAVDELRRPVVERSSLRQAPDTWTVPDPGDIAVGIDGTLYALSREKGQVYRFAQGGQGSARFDTVQDLPWAMTWSPEGLLVVSSVGDGSRLVWYQPNGAVARQAPPSLDVGIPRALASAPNGDIFVADVGRSRIVHLDRAGNVISYLNGAGRVQRPSSLLFDRDGTLWVLNASGELLRLSLDDQVLTSLPGPASSPEHGWRLVQAANGDLIMADPDAHRIVQRTQAGDLVRIWSGFERPIGLATDQQGRLFVVDVLLEEIGILPPVG